MQFSVIIPCHNAGRWIISALRSVAEQTLAPHEIIVIDDASTDNSLAQIEKSGVPVKLLHVNVRNAAASRNAGIEAATGDWIALLDADDIWYPNHLERAREMLNNSDRVAYMSNLNWISLNDEPVPIPMGYLGKLPEPRVFFSIDDYYRISRQGFHFGHSSVVYRRDRVREVGLFDPAQIRRHDIDLWLRVIADRTWVYDTSKGYAYRVDTPGSISRNEAECDYYYLRALDKNLAGHHSMLLQHYLSRQARRAVGIAFVTGPKEHYRNIRAIAWPHLPWPFKIFYACGTLDPGLLRWAMKLRRRFVLRNTPFEMKNTP